VSAVNNNAAFKKFKRKIFKYNINLKKQKNDYDILQKKKRNVKSIIKFYIYLYEISFYNDLLMSF